MAEAIISVVVERIFTIIKEQIRSEVKLVRGVYKEIVDLSDKLKRIRKVLDDADRRSLKEESVRDWLKRLEDVSYEMDDVLDEWNYAILKQKVEQSEAAVARKQKVCSFIPSSSCLFFKKVATHRDIALKIQQVKKELELILDEKDRYSFVPDQLTDPFGRSWRPQSTSFVEVEYVHGRDDGRDDLVRKLLDEDYSQEGSSIPVISIVGAGGIGKTTLAQLVYNDSRVQNCYPLRIWICVSDPFDLANIAKGIVEKERGSCPDANQMDTLLERAKASILGKRFLLVLDDVWTENVSDWEPLECCLKFGGTGSKILVTTRKERVARVMGTPKNEIHRIGLLSDEDCWSLLSRVAFIEKNENESKKFDDIGRQMAKKCKGLPLAAKTLGSLLRFKTTLKEWKDVLNSEIWELEEAKVNLFPHLLLSYNELSPILKRCFSYCAIFPKDHVIFVENLINSWLALGYLGSHGSVDEKKLRGRNYFDNLAVRSLFQDLDKNPWNEYVVESCKMHDIVHDFARFLGKETSNDGVEATCQVCSPSLVHGVRQYRSLFCYKGSSQHLCDWLTILRVLTLRDCGLKSIPKEIMKFIHLRFLDLSCNDLSSGEGFESICELYNLETLLLKRCHLFDIPIEIGNLIQLRHLDLSGNGHLLELPESICDLQELQHLNINMCRRLIRLPRGIHKLINLKHLYNDVTDSLHEYPQGIGQLTGLRILSRFDEGNGSSKLSYLKILNQLSGALLLRTGGCRSEAVAEAREAKLNEKEQLQLLVIWFKGGIVEEDANESIGMHILDALQPHPNLEVLQIYHYRGSRLPGWISSSLFQVRRMELRNFPHLSSLPPLGKLPCLEEILLEQIDGLEFVGREFLGITTGDVDIGSSSVATATNTIVFPKLKALTVDGCGKWKEWEDIRGAEEDSTALLLFPCLKELTLDACRSLTALPHRLLRKASSLEKLSVFGSPQLNQRYADKEGSAWKSISHIPEVEI